MLPEVALYVPALHMLHVVVRGALHDPSGQQTPASALLVVPIGHAVQLEEPERLYVPLGQTPCVPCGSDAEQYQPG